MSLEIKNITYKNITATVKSMNENDLEHQLPPIIVAPQNSINLETDGGVKQLTIKEGEKTVWFGYIPTGIDGPIVFEHGMLIHNGHKLVNLLNTDNHSSLWLYISIIIAIILVVWWINKKMK